MFIRQTHGIKSKQLQRCQEKSLYIFLQLKCMSYSAIGYKIYQNSDNNKINDNIAENPGLLLNIKSRQNGKPAVGGETLSVTLTIVPQPFV